MFVLALPCKPTHTNLFLTDLKMFLNIKQSSSATVYRTEGLCCAFPATYDASLYRQSDFWVNTFIRAVTLSDFHDTIIVDSQSKTILSWWGFLSSFLANESPSKY